MASVHHYFQLKNWGTKDHFCSGRDGWSINGVKVETNLKKCASAWKYEPLSELKTISAAVILVTMHVDRHHHFDPHLGKMLTPSIRCSALQSTLLIVSNQLCLSTYHLGSCAILKKIHQNATRQEFAFHKSEQPFNTVAEQLRQEVAWCCAKMFRDTIGQLDLSFCSNLCPIGTLCVSQHGHGSLSAALQKVTRPFPLKLRKKQWVEIRTCGQSQLEPGSSCDVCSRQQTELR